MRQEQQLHLLLINTYFMKLVFETGEAISAAVVKFLVFEIGGTSATIDTYLMELVCEIGAATSAARPGKASIHMAICTLKFISIFPLKIDHNKYKMSLNIDKRLKSIQDRS